MATKHLRGLETFTGKQNIRNTMTKLLYCASKGWETFMPSLQRIRRQPTDFAVECRNAAMPRACQRWQDLCATLSAYLGYSCAALSGKCALQKF